jgi:hypothetical protein
MTRHEAIKTIITAKAALYHSDLSAKKAADMVYAALDSSIMVAIDSIYPSYDVDGGDKACRCFARWIQEDRRK